MDNQPQNYHLVETYLRAPSPIYRISWFIGMSGVGAYLAICGLPSTLLLTILAILSGVSSNWSA